MTQLPVINEEYINKYVGKYFKVISTYNEDYYMHVIEYDEPSFKVVSFASDTFHIRFYPNGFIGLNIQEITSEEWDTELKKLSKVIYQYRTRTGKINELL